MCEWCGQDHDVKTLCAARPKWSRRGFLTLFGAGLVGAVAAAKIPFADFAIDTTGPFTVGGINRATFSFWRNQPMTATADLSGLKRSMREIYNNCSLGEQPDQIIIPANPEVLSAYLKLLA